jgi:hypothetical protein
MMRRALMCVAFVGFAWSSLAAETGVAVKPARVITSTVKAQAIVESVNPKTREVKLIGADNRRFTVVADNQVKNFDQIHPRDRVNVEYLESVAITVLPAGNAAAPVSASKVEVAPKGDKPGIAGVDVAEVTATITSLDREARTATLSLPDGDVRTVKVGADARLDLVDVGDRVRVTTTRAIAIAVTPPSN